MTSDPPTTPVEPHQMSNGHLLTPSAQWSQCQILSMSRHKLVSKPIPSGRMYFNREAIEAFVRQVEKDLVAACRRKEAGNARADFLFLLFLVIAFAMAWFAV